MNTKQEKHNNHEVVINWGLTNKHGRPALCCKQCIQRKGSRRGKFKYIDWIGAHAIPLYKKFGVEEVFKDDVVNEKYAKKGK